MRPWLLLAFLVLAPETPAWCGFLDGTGPVQADALGGNMVGLAGESGAAFFNAAALGTLGRPEISAQYQQLFAGFSSEDLEASELEGVLPFQDLGSAGLFWDHFGADLLEQDRLKLAWGVPLDPGALPGHLSLGFAAAGLRQSFTLSSPLPGINVSQLNAQAFSMDAGVLAQPWTWLSLGFSGQDLNQPDLGVVGVARLPVTLRWGLGLLLPGGLTVNLAQSSSAALLESQAGLQWTLPASLFSLRCGLDSSSLGAGFGVAWSSLRLDYAYQWSLPGGDADGLPGTHSLALAYAWASAGGRAQQWADKAKQALAESRFSDALSDVRMALALDPGDASYSALLAGARQAWDRQQAATYAGQGQKALSQGRAQDAVQYLKWACSLDPSNAAYLAQLSAAQGGLATGILSDALIQKQLETVLDCLARGQTQAARDALQPALDHAPGDASLQALAKLLSASSSAAPAAQPAASTDTLRWMEDALRFSGQGQGELARQAWQKVLKADPGNALAQQALKADSGRPQAGAEDLKKAQALFSKGLSAYQLGDLRTAIRLWQQCLELDPNNLNAQNNLSRARIELENPN